MADRIYLSLWLDDYSTEAMLPVWAKALGEFPVSSLSPGIRQLAVFPFQWRETPVLAQSFQEGTGVGEAIALAAEFLHSDYAYEVELNWDVWVPRQEGSLDQWERLPLAVSVACLGAEFEEEETEDRPHLLFDLGLDSLFLPPEADKEFLGEALEGVAGNCYRENLAQLLGYVRKLEKNLPVARRLLWSASGEDLAECIRTAYGQ